MLEIHTYNTLLTACTNPTVCVVCIHKPVYPSPVDCTIPGAYRAGKVSEGACNSYIDCIDIEIQTWPTFTTFSNMPNMALTRTFT